MPDKKISELFQAVTPDAADEFAINQSGVSKSLTLQQIKDFADPKTASTYLKRNAGNTAYEAKTPAEVAADLPNLMVEIGAFVSTSQARRAGREGNIPEGFSFEFKASKKKRIFIWNPTE